MKIIANSDFLLINCRPKHWPRSAAAGLATGLALLVHITALARTSTIHAAQLQTAVVTRVVDGDTVWLKTADSTRALKVRIIGIDAPEICQSGGPASREALAGRLQGKTVSFAMPTSRSYDDYGRALARIYRGGEDIGRWMVGNGYAWSYGWRNNTGIYAAEQASAIAAQRGIFALPGTENPRAFRKRHGSCRR